MSATFNVGLFINYFQLKPDYRDVGLILQTEESLKLKYEIQRNWITCNSEYGTVIFP